MKEEIAEIDERAFEMATSVAHNPSLRETLAPEASDLRHRLSMVLNEIESLEHAEYTKLSHQILEAMRDLTFVEKDSRLVSIRLAREIGRTKQI